MEALERALYEHSKTPVMWLQEICVKQGCAHPTYQERDLRSHVSEPPKFEVTATVLSFDVGKAEVSCPGVATTKKAAKQIAATALLYALGITPKDLADVRSTKILAGPSPYSVPKSIPDPKPVDVETPMEVDVAMNGEAGKNANDSVDGGNRGPVVDELSKLLKNVNISPTSCVDLLELCGKRGLPNPEYTEVKAEGPPHCRTFYIECRIKALNGKEDLCVTVSENQKKKAKNLSAATMLHKIKSEAHTEESIVQLLSAVDKQLPEPSRAVCTDRKRCHDLVAHLHHRYHSLIGPAILDLHENNNDLLAVDYEMILQRIAVDENFTVSYKPVPETNDLNKYQCYCELTYPRNTPLSGPPAVCVGEGDTIDSARKNSALEAIMFLKIVSKP